MVCIDNVKTNGCGRFNSEMYRFIFCPGIQPNASKLLGHFTLQMDNDCHHTSKVESRLFEGKEMYYSSMTK